MHRTVNDDLMPPTAMSELETLSLRRAATGKVCLELGAELGYSTITMSKVAERVISIDWHKGYENGQIGPKQDTLIPYLWNVRDFLANVVPIVGKFEDILPLFGDASFDFIFQDGGHDYDSTRFCFEQAARLIKPDGVIATHDFGHPKCAEALVAQDLGWVPRLPVVGTLAIFDPEGRRGVPTGVVPSGVNYHENPWQGATAGEERS